jgi:hypothetical protein
LDGNEWLPSRLGHVTSENVTLVPIRQEADGPERDEIPSLACNKTPIVQPLAHTKTMQTSPTGQPSHFPPVVTFPSHHAFFYFQLPNKTIHKNLGNDNHMLWARGSVVGSGTMLQAGRSLVLFQMRSLDFF